MYEETIKKETLSHYFSFSLYQALTLNCGGLTISGIVFLETGWAEVMSLAGWLGDTSLAHFAIFNSLNGNYRTSPVILADRPATLEVAIPNGNSAASCTAGKPCQEV